MKYIVSRCTFYMPPLPSSHLSPLGAPCRRLKLYSNTFMWTLCSQIQNGFQLSFLTPIAASITSAATVTGIAYPLSEYKTERTAETDEACRLTSSLLVCILLMRRQQQDILNPLPTGSKQRSSVTLGFSNRLCHFSGLNKSSRIYVFLNIVLFLKSTYWNT